MVTYKIYGSPQSVYTRLALLAFHEKDVPYTIVPTNPVDGDTKKGAYLEMNPWGRIPVMVGAPLIRTTLLLLLLQVLMKEDRLKNKPDSRSTNRAP